MNTPESARTSARQTRLRRHQPRDGSVQRPKDRMPFVHWGPNLTENPYNAPEHVYDYMQTGHSGMLNVLRKLGPGRVQYAGHPPIQSTSPDNSLTSWMVDGERRTVREIFDLGKEAA